MPNFSGSVFGDCFGANGSAEKGEGDFERDVVDDPPAMNDRLQVPHAGYLAAGGAVVGTGSSYTCAWGPNDDNKPKMLRLIVRVDDPNGRLSNGQTVEYVINLQ